MEEQEFKIQQEYNPAPQEELMENNKFKFFNKKIIILILTLLVIIFPLIITPIVYDAPEEDIKEMKILEVLQDEKYEGGLGDFYTASVDSKDVIIKSDIHSPKLSAGEEIMVFDPYAVPLVTISGNPSDEYLEEKKYFATDTEGVYKKYMYDYYIRHIKRSNDIYWPEEKNILLRLYELPVLNIFYAPLTLLCPISGDDCTEERVVGSWIETMVYLIWIIGTIAILTKSRRKVINALIILFLMLFVIQIIEAGIVYYGSYKKIQQKVKVEERKSNDEKYGCDYLAGYRWTEEARVCLRAWKKEPKDVLRFVAEHLGWTGDATILSAESLDCVNCYVVKIKRNTTNEYGAYIYDNGKITETDTTYDDCRDAEVDFYECHDLYPKEIVLPINNSTDATIWARRKSKVLADFINKYENLGDIEYSVETGSNEGDWYWKALFSIENTDDLWYEVHILRDDIGTILYEGQGIGG
ncbi:hypothetical protein HON36_00765 [Candidatus Parcubacteria bacterium]|nr:hypothetical protein [Candidatus Parcubacteria bacterium]